MRDIIFLSLIASFVSVSISSCKTSISTEAIQTDTLPIAPIQVAIGSIDTTLFNRMQYVYCDSLNKIDSLNNYPFTYPQVSASLPTLISVRKERSNYGTDSLDRVYFNNYYFALTSDKDEVLRSDIGEVTIIADGMIDGFLIFNRKTQKGYQIKNLKISIYDILVQTYCIQDKVIVCVRESYEAGFMRDTYFLTDQHVSKVQVLGVFESGATKGADIVELSIHGDSQVRQNAKGEVYVAADFTVVWNEEKKELYPFRIPINLKTGEFERKAPTIIPNTFDWHVLDYKCEHLVIEKL